MSVTPIGPPRKRRAGKPLPPTDLINHPDRLLTVEEWAGMVGLSPSHARALLGADQVPGAFKQGTQWRVPLRAHTEYVRNLQLA